MKIVALFYTKSFVDYCVLSVYEGNLVWHMKKFRRIPDIPDSWRKEACVELKFCGKERFIKKTSMPILKYFEGDLNGH